MTNVGVAISTQNRRDILLTALEHWLAHTPHDVPIVVVDDGSDEPFTDDRVKVVRHQHPKGVGATKNRGIAELRDLGVEHLFLADDDVWPTRDGWWHPYVDSPEHHLSYQWPRPNRLSKWSIIPQRGHPLDGTHFALGFPRGVLLYMDRHAVDTIGGMDPTYGRGEHVEWQYRAWLAGLTTFTQRDPNGVTVAAYGDVTGSNQIWHALDEHQRIESTFGDVEERRQLDAAGARNWGRNWPGGKPRRIDPWTGEHAIDTVYCWYCVSHPPHRWSPYENTPGEGPFLCRGWHGRPNEYSPDADNRALPDDANYTTAWHDLNAPTWDMFLPERIENALEVGSYEGRSANWLLTHRQVGHLTCVDPFANNTDPCSVGDYSTRFDRNVIQPFGDKVTKVCGYSPHAVPDGEYDFVYIDGEHSYEQTMLDLERSWPMLTDDGLMIVDDIAFWVERFAPLRATEDFFRDKPHELVFDGYQRGYRKP